MRNYQYDNIVSMANKLQNVIAGTTVYTQFVNFFMSASLPSEWKTIDDVKKAFGNYTYELPRVQ